MKLESLPAWLPDWKNDDAYPQRDEDWSPYGWAWAFLRRNTDYRADYERFAALPSYYSHGGKTSKWSGRSPADDDDMALRYCDPPALPGETWKQYWVRVKDKVVDEMPLEAFLMNKWGVVTLENPADEEALIGSLIETPPEVIEIPRAEPSGTGYWSEWMPSADGREHVTIRFDLRFSVEKQIDRAQEILLERIEDLSQSNFPLERIKSGGKHRDFLPKYLRAFDANWQGATNAEIGKKLFPKKYGEESGDSLKAAVRRAIANGTNLVNGGYKDLLK